MTVKVGLGLSVEASGFGSGPGVGRWVSNLPRILGGSGVVISGVISKVTIIITLIRGLITHL